jgi:hypothetical protein
MPALSGKAVGWLSCAGAAVLVALLGACASLPPVGSVAIPPVAAGMARAWFYRDDQPYISTSRSYVRMNGAIVGISEDGGAFYRDVSPGQYYVTVDSYGVDINQFPQATLVPGETAYFKIFVSNVWASGGATTNWARPTFYVWQMPTAMAIPELARTPFYPGDG